MRLECLAACTFLLASGSAIAADPPADRPIRTMDDLVRLNRCELEELYRHCAIGCPPSGVVRGRAIVNPGSKSTVAKSKVIAVLWQGKEITDDTMKNRVLGMRVVPARVYVGESWLDGKSSIIMDYAGTSKLFGKYRDEVREVSAGLYLGLTHKRTQANPELKVFFALDSRK
jgi:hypothetical protein